MNGFGLARIGRDVELRHTQGGEAVASLSLAFTYGHKGEDGKRPTQWVDAALWGKQAEALSPYLKKGGLVSVTLADLRIETYEGKNGAGHKLAARVIGIDLAGDGKRDDAAAPAAKPAPAPKPSTGSGFDDMVDDIPF